MPAELAAIQPLFDFIALHRWWAATALAVGLIVRLLKANPTCSLAWMSLALTGCAGWGKTTCAIVDVAEASCAQLRYMGSDGKVHEVPVEPAELRAFGEQVSAKRAGERARGADGGAP